MTEHREFILTFCSVKDLKAEIKDYFGTTAFWECFLFV